MSDTEFCRLCVNLTNSTTAVKLFDRSRRKLLRQIEELIGQRIKNVKDLPQLICRKCQEQTTQAHLFRECCIRAQKHFATAAYKTQINSHGSTVAQECSNFKHQNKVAAPPIEDVVLNGISTVKDEVAKEEKLEVRVIPTESVLLKHEPCTLNTENCFANDGYMPLSRDYHDAGELQLKKLRCSMMVADEIKVANEEEFLNSDVSSDYKATQRYRVGRPRGTKTETNSSKKKNTKNEKSTTMAKKADYICDQCGTHFSNFTVFTTHLRRHAGEKPFQCEICPDKFLSQAQLLRHVRKHTGEKPYPCRHCERRFLDLSARLRHERVHNNERPFACQECGKAFTVGHTLKEHMRIHTGERPFVCKICKVSFTIKAHLVTHCRSMTHKQNEQKQLNLTNQDDDASVIQMSNNSDWGLN